MGVAEAKFAQSIFLDWEVTAEIEHFVTSSSAIMSGRRIGLGGMRHMETRYLWIQEELHAQRMKLTNVKGTENATDVATEHVDAATLMKCMVPKVTQTPKKEKRNKRRKSLKIQQNNKGNKR